MSEGSTSRGSGVKAIIADLQQKIAESDGEWLSDRELTQMRARARGGEGGEKAREERSLSMLWRKIKRVVGKCDREAPDRGFWSRIRGSSLDFGAFLMASIVFSALLAGLCAVYFVPYGLSPPLPPPLDTPHPTIPPHLLLQRR